MSLARAFRTYFSQNPIVGRLVVTRYTGPALGFAFLLVTGALLVADVIVLANTADISEAGGMEAGTILHGIHCLVLTGLLTLLLPMKVAGAGALDGLRADRALDQLVVTGISPVRYCFGNFTLGCLYGLSLLLVSLPFEVHAWLLGGVSLGAIALGMGQLALYSGFLVAVTLGMAVREPERHAAVGVIVLGLLAGSLAFAPLPPVLAEVSPVRFFLRQEPDWIRLVELDPLLVSQDPVLFFWKVPLKVYPLLLWGFLSLPFVLMVIAGPSHRFRSGEDNFGGSTPRGGGRDRWLAALGGGLARRVDLAFLYENRPRWLDRWSAPLRYGTGLLFVVAVWSVCVGITFPGGILDVYPRRGYYGDRAFMALVITGTFLLFAFLFCGDTFFRERWRVRCWAWRVRRGALFTACALLLVAAFASLHLGVLMVGESQERSAIHARLATMVQPSVTTMPPATGEVPGGITPEGVSPEEVAPSSDTTRALWTKQLTRLEEYGTTGRWVIASAVLLLLNAHFLGKVLTYFSPVAFLWRFAFLCGMGLLLTGPIFLLRAMEAGWLPWSLQPLSFLSPFVLGTGDTWHRHRDEAIFYPSHLLALGVLLGVLLLVWLILVLTLRMIARRSRRRASRGSAPALILVLAVLASGSVRAQSPPAKGRLPVDLQATHAFEGRLFQERVDFLTLVVKNRGTETLRGTVRLDIGRDDSSRGSRRTLEAPPGTATVVRWTEAYDHVFATPNWTGRVLFETADGAASADLDPLWLRPLLPRGLSGPQLLVVEDREPEARGFLPVLRTPTENWTLCRSLFLPEEHQAYSGVNAVIVAGSDLSRWTDLQRMALYDYLRSGGTVIFSGDSRRHGLESCAPWGSALPLASISRPALPELELSPSVLEDGHVTWAHVPPGFETSIPLLTVRSLGPGRAGHLSFDVLSNRWGTGLGLGDRARETLESHLPWSRYSSTLLGVGTFASTQTPEDSWLFATLVYFGPYVVLVGPGLMIAFARRRRRRWLPVAVIGLPILFLLGLPGLGTLLESRSSGALVSEVVMFGPGSRRGVVQAIVSVQSRGRQDHDLVLEGKALSVATLREGTSQAAWRPQGLPVSPAYLETPEVTRLLRLTDDRLQFRMPPWGTRRFRVVGDLDLERPIEGELIYDPRSNQLSVRVTGLPGAPDNAPAFLVCCNVNAQGSRHSFSLRSMKGGEINEVFELERAPRDKVTFEGTSITSRQQPPSRRSVTLDFPQPILGNRSGNFRVRVSDDSAPVAFVVFGLVELPLPVTAENLVFEAETGPGPDMPTVQARRIRARLRDHIKLGGTDLVERDGRFILKHKMAALIQELRVTVR